MKPSEMCKRAGLKSLTELSVLTGKPTQTLLRWHIDMPKLFEIVVRGAVSKKMSAAFVQPKARR